MVSYLFQCAHFLCLLCLVMFLLFNIIRTSPRSRWPPSPASSLSALLSSKYLYRRRRCCRLTHSPSLTDCQKRLDCTLSLAISRSLWRDDCSSVPNANTAAYFSLLLCVSNAWCPVQHGTEPCCICEYLSSKQARTRLVRGGRATHQIISIKTYAKLARFKTQW